MNRRSFFRKALGLGAAAAVAPVAAKIVAALPEPAPLPAFLPVNLPSVWASDASILASSVTRTNTAGNGASAIAHYTYANSGTPCYEVKGGRLVFKGFTEDMDCPFPPEDWS